MAFNLASITRSVRIKAPRIVLLGVEKIGKSTFASQSHNPIFVPIAGEEGIDSINVAQFPTVGTYQDSIECLKTLYNDEHNYGTVVIDSASALEPIVWRCVCKRCNNADGIADVKGGYGWGYIEALTEWRTITDILDALRTQKNMASVIIGHVKVKRFDNPTTRDSYDQYQFDINEKAANLFYRWADAILFCNNKIIVKKQDAGFGKTVNRGVELKEDARYLYTRRTPAHPGGGRGIYGQLPYELPLNWMAYQQAIEETIKHDNNGISWKGGESDE